MPFGSGVFSEIDYPKRLLTPGLFRPAKDRALCLERFLDAGQLDPALFSGRSLHLLPDGPAAHHPYAVLTVALRQRGKWALGRVVLSNHRQLVLLPPPHRVSVVPVLPSPCHL